MMIPSILRGSVLTTSDPTGLGRVKVQIPQATGTASLWAEPMQQQSASVPAAGSAVWIVFESGDTALPVYIPASAYGPWTPIPAAWLAGNWEPYSGAYRLGPGARVQYQGELATPNAATSTTINNASAVLTLPAALQPVYPSSIPVGILPGGVAATTVAVLRVNAGSASLYGGPWTYTGTSYLSLAAVGYSVTS